MIGAHNGLLKKIKDSLGDKKVFDVGSLVTWPICAIEREQEFMVNVEDFVINIYYHFEEVQSMKHS